jgi:phosphomevalonate kinase
MLPKKKSKLCFLAAEEYSAWIISDARRSTDVQYFKQQYGDKVKTVRIVASEKIRTERGFAFSSGIDDAESECGLDHITDWDVIIKNEGDNCALEKDIQLLLDLCEDK